jgi:hypothetical protein
MLSNSVGTHYKRSENLTIIIIIIIINLEII